MKRLVYTLLLFLLSITLRTEIVKILVTNTEPYENGRLFGNIGSYEKVYGQIIGEVDPNHTLNRIIQDIDTGWSIRQKGFGEGDLASLSGMFIPFAKTKRERIMSGDPRLSLEERYGNHEGYVSAVRKAAEKLVKSGFLLPEDAQNEITKAEQSETLNSR